jgi:hypothetical protein
MNEQQRAVVQQALEALEFCQAPIFRPDRSKREEAITALRQLLEQPATEDSSEVDHGDELTIAYLDGVHTGKKMAKREWVGLTNEQANLLINGRGEEGDDDYVEPTGDGFGLTDEDLVKLIRRVEAHHGIGAKP